MKKKDIQTWVKALRSGKYKQTAGSLCRNGETESFCCLGVAIDVLCDGEWEYNESENSWTYNGSRSAKIFDGHGMPGMKTLKKIGLRKSAAIKLANLNDDGENFKSIAKWIEANQDKL